MRHRRKLVQLQRPRDGFTILELLVVIGVISVLLTLVMPAVLSARSAARRTQCQANLKNIGIAITAHAQSLSRLPPGGTWSPTTPEGYSNWVQELLPYLQRNDIAESWHRDIPYNDPGNLVWNNLNIPVLNCPDDVTILSSTGNLSYGANGGFGWSGPGDCPSTLHAMTTPVQWIVPIDLNGDGQTCAADTDVPFVGTDRKLMHRAGVFFMESHPLGTGTVRFHSLDTMLDGASNTIWVVENFRAGYDPFFPDFGGWASPEAWRSCVFVSGYTCDNLQCAAGKVDYSRANSKSLPYHWEGINAGHTQPEGRAPWANSYHLGGFNVVFGDGHVKFLSEQLDGRVYASLMSPQGSMISGPLAQGLISEADY